ncbi:ankyrin repeat domain-containing protein 50-like [Haliotis rubra]|uniref:ankyrin repeat domain-containing protein 50-like n=1 Tax=Haliotis rubra TaxID=36100 RepID=UPI001EE50034|nr:ankyrin repeat domain-containing protein 50-like [Haliotis rubra]
MWAASGGHREVVELLVSKGANVKLVDRFGINILHSACMGGDIEVVKYVLSQNMVDINDRVQCGRTAVMLAAENGHKDMVALLVDKEADVSLLDDAGDNILHCACRGGDAELVKYILSQKIIDMNSLGHDKNTPVMVAVECDHKEVVEVHLKYEAKLLLGDKNRDDALHRACYAGQFDVVKYLLSLTSVDINSRGLQKRTPLMVAAEQGHKEVVELLVKHGADLFLRDEHGDNALHRACYPGRFDVVKYLLSLNSVDINSGGFKKRTPAMSAAVWGQTKVAKLLVKHGADLSLSGIEGNVLHVACQRGQLDHVKYILSLNRVDIDSRGWKRGTPVMVASRQKRKEVVELLVQHGTDLSLIDGADENILHHTCVTGFLHVVKYILSLHAVHINRQGMEGQDTSDNSSKIWT